MPPIDRRTLLALGAGAVGTLAGCGAPSADDAGTTATGTATETASATATATATGTDSSAPPGGDVLGGPDGLQSSAAVEALSLDSDEGAGQFVFSPAVAWVEPGTTVEWSVASGSHSVTAYHPDNDKPLRIPEDAASFDSGVMEAGGSFSHSFDTEGVYNYYCTPHEGLGMVGLVVAGGPQGGPGVTELSDVGSSAAVENLKRLFDLAGISLREGGGGVSYGWQDATWDSYWYSLYNMSTNIAMSGNGVLFPHNEEQQAAFEKRFPAMLEAAGQEKPPVKNPNLNMAAFTEGDPYFTQEPVLAGEDGRPDASTLAWDRSNSSGVVSPSSLGWTHLKGVTWAKNFQNHFDVLPESLAAEFRSEVLATLAQIGVKATLIAGGPEGNGALTNGESLELVSGFAPGKGEVVDATARPVHHSAMLWFMSDLTSLAHGGWFGYENPEPLVPAENIQNLTDGIAKTTMNLFEPGDVVEMGSTRDLGQLLGAVGYYAPQAGSDELRSTAADYADGLASLVEQNLAGNGMVEGGADNQAATQGIVAQGLVWASEMEGVDYTDTAADVVGYMVEELWDADAGTFATGEGDTTYTITARDAGDITGGINAADAVLGLDVKERYATFFNQTFNRGRLQRAERPPSRDENAEFTLPLPPAAGGEFGQAAVYNAAVAYDTGADEWSVVDRTFDTEASLYLANQDIWISQWGGDFYQGRGVPGTNDAPKS